MGGWRGAAQLHTAMTMLQDYEARHDDPAGDATLWLNEVRSAFRPASIAGATVWDRAKAVTYLRERFVPRFRSERQAAANLVASCSRRR